MSALSSSAGTWYLIRARGVVSTVLLTGVLALGIATTNRWRPGRLPRFVTLGLHRNVSLLALAFLAVHVTTAVIDPYAQVGLLAAAVPFVAARGAIWVGLGAVSLDLVAALIASSLLRRRLGRRAWRGIHWLAYAAWPLALAHGLGLGSDGRTPWLLLVSASCLAVVGAAVVWRLRRIDGRPKHLEPRPVAAAPARAVPPLPARGAERPRARPRPARAAASEGRA